MEKCMRNTYCFYHGDDWDGVTSAAVVQRAEHRNVIMVPLSYGENINQKVFDVVKKDDIVYMVDFSIKPVKRMDDLRKQCKAFIWIDHHADAIDACKNEEIRIDGLQKSGTAACILTFKFFFPQAEIPYGLQLIGDWDVHNLENPDVELFFYGLEINKLHPQLSVLTSIIYDDKKVVDKVLKDGILISQYEKKEKITRAIRNGFDIDFGDYKAFAVNGMVSIDDLVNSGLYNKEKYHFIFIFTRYSNWWKVSLRTNRDDVDVSEICGRFGGGGHKQASGFEVNDDVITQMIKGQILIKQQHKE